LVIFLLTLFENTLKYTYVSQQANINRPKAKDKTDISDCISASHSVARPAGPVELGRAVWHSED